MFFIFDFFKHYITLSGISDDLKVSGSFRNILEISQKIFPFPITIKSFVFSKFKSSFSLISLSSEPLYQLTILLEGRIPFRLSSLSIPKRRSLSAPHANITPEYFYLSISIEIALKLPELLFKEFI